ncbi:MAG TPA: hypothetical protein VIV12_11520 [Streptosporangiaceae bacterium]
MKLKISYHLMNGQVIDQGADGASVEEVREKVNRILARPGTTVILAYPGGCDVVRVDAIAHVMIAPAEDA